MTEQAHLFGAGAPVKPGQIVAIEVPNDLRPDFFPKHFGARFLLRGELLVYAWMDRLCDGYGGGFWRFFELSNGGFYMAPKLPGPFHIRVDSNGFSGDLGADAAGVVITLFALCHLASEGHERFADAHRRLLDYAYRHEEHPSILKAID